MEALTLIQTKKSRRIPLILVGRAYWQGLLDWFAQTLVKEGMIDEKDLDLLQVIDAIFAHYEKRGFEPSPREREIQLSL